MKTLAQAATRLCTRPGVISSSTKSESGTMVTAGQESWASQSASIVRGGEPDPATLTIIGTVSAVASGLGPLLLRYSITPFWPSSIDKACLNEAMTDGSRGRYASSASELSGILSPGHQCRKPERYRRGTLELVIAERRWDSVLGRRPKNKVQILWTGRLGILQAAQNTHKSTPAFLPRKHG